MWYSDDMENNEKIKELRKRTGLSQSKFAERFHLGVKAVQSWENNWRNCPEHVVYMIERILDLEDTNTGK